MSHHRSFPSSHVRPGRHPVLGLGLVAVAAALALPGCTKDTSSNLAIADTASGDLRQSLVIHNKQFAKDVRIVDLKVREQGDLLEGFVVVQNTESETVPFEYKMQWFDADDLPVESPIETWEPALLNGKETKIIRQVAPRADATGFKFHVRGPNPVDP